jgi:hypothetical protein
MSQRLPRHEMFEPARTVICDLARIFIVESDPAKAESKTGAGWSGEVNPHEMAQTRRIKKAMDRGQRSKARGFRPAAVG